MHTPIVMLPPLLIGLVIWAMPPGRRHARQPEVQRVFDVLVLDKTIMCVSCLPNPLTLLSKGIGHFTTRVLFGPRALSLVKCALCWKLLYMGFLQV